MPTEAQSRGDHLSVSLAMSIYKLKHETSIDASTRDNTTTSFEKFVIRLRLYNGNACSILVALLAIGYFMG